MSRMLHVFDLSVSGQVVGAASRAPGTTTESTRRHPLTTCSSVHPETLTKFSGKPFVVFVGKRTPHLFVAIDAIAFRISMISITGSTPRGFCLSGFHREVSWTRTRIIVVIASSAKRVSVLAGRERRRIEVIFSPV
jgi:hypothetical protein